MTQLASRHADELGAKQVLIHWLYHDFVMQIRYMALPWKKWLKNSPKCVLLSASSNGLQRKVKVGHPLRLGIFLKLSTFMIEVKAVCRDQDQTSEQVI